MLSNLQLAVLTLLTLVEAGPGPTVNRTFTTLDGNRNKLTFVPYTAAQKSTTAEGIKNLFAIYGNRWKKLDSYDKEYKARFNVTIDPVPRSVELAAKAATLSDTEFHYAYNDLFYSLRGTCSAL
ncbi:hypothetical protein HDU91_000854 [Kappamyces sp. JEL0680]|nr:hypothetical protein HDU91_000854 [Kappamyces sp. JEL0680]